MSRFSYWREVNKYYDNPEKIRNERDQWIKACREYADYILNAFKRGSGLRRFYTSSLLQRVLYQKDTSALVEFTALVNME